MISGGFSKWKKRGIEKKISEDSQPVLVAHLILVGGDRWPLNEFFKEKEKKESLNYVFLFSFVEMKKCINCIVIHFFKKCQCFNFNQEQ